MQSLFQTKTAWIYALIVLATFASCRKDPANENPQNTQNKRLNVVLNHYLSSLKVDSAFAVWEINGQLQKFKMDLHNDTVSADIKLFEEGVGKLTIRIFSKIKFNDQYLSQWVQEKQISIKHDKHIQLTGPSSFTDSQWLPRVMLKDDIGHFAVIALRPDDPYFFIKGVKPNVKKMRVGRTYWKTTGGVSMVGGGEWQCSACTNTNGDIENEQFYSFLPTQIGTRTWNHIEIVVLYEEDQWGGGPVLSLNHTIQ